MRPTERPRSRRGSRAFKAEAKAKGISQGTLDAAFANVDLNQRVIELNENQPEFSRAIWDYMDSAVSSDRVSKGRTMMRKYRKSLGRAERKHGVPAEHHHRDLVA